MTAFEATGRAEEIRDLTARRIELFGSAGSTWRFAASLKSISEDTAQEYEGRALLELIQNGHDALGGGPPGRIHVLLDESGDAPVLYVANDGTPFSSTNFLAIVGFGLSDKGAGEGIGNKGLGFRSVLQLTDHPEVYSRNPDDSSDRAFSGYSFRFPTDEQLSGLTDDPALAERVVAEVSPLDLPLPAAVEDPEVERFGADGFATVVRLPLRDDAAVEDVRRQVETLASADAPVLLFLDRVADLHLTIRSADEEPRTSVLSRREQPTSLVLDGEAVWEIDLGDQGRYLLTRRPTCVADLRDAVRRSAAARLVDKRWLDWDGEAWVGVALRLDQALQAGTTYTYLPMDEPSPLAAHVHAPFFTKLARRNVSLEVPLNDFLMGEIASACLDLAQTLREQGGHAAVAGHVVDLVAWAPTRHRFLARACTERGTTLETEAFLPVAGKSEWTSLQEGCEWPRRLAELAVVSAVAVAALGCPVLDPEIGPERQSRIAALRKALLGGGMEPSKETLADWAESLAAALKADGSDFERWARYYDDLSVVFDRTSASALRGRRVVLDRDLGLRPAMGGEREVRRAPVLFFAPSVEEGGAEAVGAARLPKELETRIVYTHPSIPWTVAGGQRPGRQFLDTNGLVREYQTERLLELLGEVMSARPTRRVQVAALQFGCALYPSLNEAQRAVLAGIDFAAPTAHRRWLPARSLAFSQPWGTTAGALLDCLVRFATEETPGLAALADRLLADPADWPFLVEDQARWEDFLRAVGVQDGIPLERVDVEAADGNRLQPGTVGAGLDVTPAVRELWEADVRAVWSGGTNPYTHYRFSSGITALPGAGEAELLCTEAREVYAELVVLGLATWPDDAFEVVVSRPQRRIDQQDAHRWPSPLKSYLCGGRWIPLEDVEDEDLTTFAPPSDVWVSLGGQLPRFVPGVTPAVRNHVRAGTALDRLKELGVRTWEDPENCGAVLQSVPELLASGWVAPHDSASFKKQCRQAWDQLVRDPARWPWPDDTAPTVVVTEGGQVRSLSVTSEVTVVVPDDTDQTKQTLIGLTAQPVLVADPARGRELTELMRQHGVGVRPTSSVSVDVYGDDQLVVAGLEAPPLVADDRQWIATLTALVAELRSGPFTRHTEQSIRQILERLRAVRVVLVDEVRIVLGGEEIVPPAQTTSLPIDDGVAPTVVVWPSGVTVLEELERCASSIAYLVGQPLLADALQLAFTRLRQVCPSPAEVVTDDLFAHALQVSEEQVRESRADLRGPLVGLLDHARALVSYFGGSEELATFELKARDVTDDSEVVAALEAVEGPLPLPPAELVHRCRAHPTLADLRDALGLDFVAFNEALARLDPPHGPLRHPDRHDQAMARFVEAHDEAILSRLREAYLSRALEGGDLTGYGEGRSHEGLTADPEWLDLFAEPPEEVVAEKVGEWLAGHGASSDLDCPSVLPEVKALREHNFGHLDEIVREADPRLRAWCRKHGLDMPSGWSSPVGEARSALETSYLADFSYLTSEQLLDVVAEALGWPPSMPRTTDPEALGLEPSDLLSKEQAEADDRRRRQHERTRLQIDGRDVPVDVESLADLADAVASGVTEELLAQSGKVALASLPGRSESRSGNPGGRGLTMARYPRMSEEQRTAVGLVGEVVARAWLERHHLDVDWVSGYRNIVLGGTRGSDSLGYDFEVRGRSRRTLYFEVKSLVGEAGDLAEFELGEAEVVAAQRRRDAYRILLVCGVLESTSRQIFELPNPLGGRGAGRYTLLGRGLRYRCAFER
ncbi:MAG: DUF3883 domain-containing protein [Actinomycetota bacterium]|jgi:hypothetical protein|nr:DUF3883 domain-containing protein [Actinomycetota bacterium]